MEIREIYNKNLDQSIYFSESDHGIKVFYLPKKGFTKKYAIFSTNYGSVNNLLIDENNKKTRLADGIAHFLEHKLFESAEGDMFSDFSKLGANVNAFTNFNQTSYLFNTSENFYEALKLLVKLVQNPYLTEENIEKEKGIIAQEIKMYEDNPSWRVFFNLLKALYVKHPVKIDIAGTVESIQEIDKDLLEFAYNNSYHPSNMVLCVTGDLDFHKVMDSVNASSRKFEAGFKKLDSYFEEEPKGIKEKYIEEKMQTSMPIFYLGYKESKNNLKGKALVKRDIITNIILEILFGESSSFYNDLYERGLIDNSFGAHYNSKETYGYSSIYGHTKEPDRLIKEIRDLLEGDYTIDEEEFARIKKKNMGQFLMGMNSMEFIANNFTSLYFDDFYIIDYLDLMEEISLDELNDRIKEHFIDDNKAVSVVKPL